MQSKKRRDQKDNPAQIPTQPVRSGNPLHDAGLAPQGGYAITVRESGDVSVFNVDHQVLSSEVSTQAAHSVGDDALMRV